MSGSAPAVENERRGPGTLSVAWYSLARRVQHGGLRVAVEGERRNVVKQSRAHG